MKILSFVEDHQEMSRAPADVRLRGLQIAEQQVQQPPEGPRRRGRHHHVPAPCEDGNFSI